MLDKRAGPANRRGGVGPTDDSDLILGLGLEAEESGQRPGCVRAARSGLPDEFRRRPVIVADRVATEANAADGVGGGDPGMYRIRDRHTAPLGIGVVEEQLGRLEELVRHQQPPPCLTGCAVLGLHVALRDGRRPQMVTASAAIWAATGSDEVIHSSGVKATIEAWFPDHA